MPWKETYPMKERVKFVLEWERLWEEQEGYVNVAALSRQFGVSRTCGYKWLERFVEGGRDIEALADRSRRPMNSPTRTDPRVVDAIIRARKMHPTWGPVTLRAFLERRFSEENWPCETTFAPGAELSA